MTPQNMQEAREILNAWNWNPSPELGPEGIRLQELIALALSKAEARGRLAGLEEADKDDTFINHIQSHLKDDEFVVCKICGKKADDICSRQRSSK